ncbi:MAG: DMT family transporter [Sandaracinaceae bacterium]
MSQRDEESGGALVRFQLAAGMIVFGSATPVSKIVTGAMPPFIGSLLRVAIGALVLLPFVWPRRDKLLGIPRKDWIRLGFIALFGMLGFSALMLMGMALITGVAGAIVMATTPAVTAAAAMLLMGEDATWRKLTAIALAVAGVVLLQVGGIGGGEGGGGGMGPVMEWLAGFGSATLIGSAMVFGAVCCEATYTLLGRKVSQDVDTVSVAFLAAALSIPLFIPLAAFEWSAFTPSEVSLTEWSALVWYGAGTLALGTWLWYSGVAETQGSVAAAFMGLMPVSALVLSYVLLGEPFAWMHLLGFGVVFAGVLLMSWEHARMSDD